MTVLNTLKIMRFRNVEPGTTLRFRNGYNILLGKNATGKTTLLELIGNAISLDLSDYAWEPFKIEFQLTSNTRTMRVEAENARVADADSVDHAYVHGVRPHELGGRANVVIEEAGRTLLRYTVDGATVDIQAPGQQPRTYPLRFPIFGDNLLLPVLFATSHRQFAGDSYSLIQPFRIFRLVRFDESLAFFERITTESRIHLWFEPNGAVRGFGSLAPVAVATLVAKAVKHRASLATVEIADLPLLAKLNSLLGFRAASLYVERLEKIAATEDAMEQADYGHFRFAFTRHDGSVIDHSRLSYGQKRLLAFHFWLATFEDFAVADELVNGLHHEWISSSIEALEGRQSFLTTQHPLLLDYLQFNTEHEVVDSFILCKSTTPVAGPERMRWANISEKDGCAFYRAYKAGIEHVSEILVSRGLW